MARLVVAIALLSFAACDSPDVSARRAPLLRAGAEAEADLSFLTVAPARVRHVATSGDDANDGAEATPWRTVRHAIDSAAPGDEIVVHEGTYAEHVVPAIDGTASAPIRVRADGAVTLTATADDPLVRLTRAFWVVEGFEIDMAGRRDHAVRFEGARSSALIGCDVHGGVAGGAIAIYGGASDVLVERNVIHDFTNTEPDGSPKDSHAIFVVPDAERVMIRANEAYENSGDGFQCAGRAEGNEGADDPHDIVLEDNRFHHNRENAVDIKSCRQITVRGGPLDESKFYGHGESSTARGEGMVIHYDASRILVTRTRFWDNCTGIAIGRDETSSLVEDVVIHRNVFFDLKPVTSTCRGNGVHISRASGVEIVHNTFDAIPNAAVVAGPSASYAPYAENVRVWNSIVRDAGRWLDVRVDGAPGFFADRNVYWNTDGRAEGIRLDGALVAIDAWRGESGQDETSVVADPLFVADPRSDDYFTQPGSPARDEAIDDTGAEVCGEGPDIGFLETCPRPDGGPGDTDGGGSIDAGAESDASTSADAGEEIPADGGGVVAEGEGCGCAIPRTDRGTPAWLIALAVLLALRARPRRRV